jgi:S-adenosylmethionine:tRNA ribosyltransferase-isomerase
MRLEDFDYELPPERIAQRPIEPRDASRLLVLPRAGGPLRHAAFRDLPALLAPGDLLVLNDTKVIPARLGGVRATGGKIECLLVRDRGGGRWEALLRAGGRLREGERLSLAGGRLEARLVAKREDGSWALELTPPEAVPAALAEAGEMPLPPYIARGGEADPALRALDRDRYQTVFAREPGAVAAPTAGLHFTAEVFRALEARGVARAFITLHVGPGTFRPIQVEDPREHVMHAEPFAIPEETARAIAAARARGGRVIACGTTAARTLETFARTGERRGETALYIFPGFEWRLVDGLVTNFHLPRSTLLLLVAALAGRERVLAAYREAIERGYRFYSYGDAMLIA